MSLFSSLVRLVKRWSVEREYQCVLIDLTAAREHLSTLEAVYQDYYHVDLVRDIIDYQCRVAELTDELEGISARRRNLS